MIGAVTYTNSATTSLSLNDHSSYDVVGIEGLWFLQTEAQEASIPRKTPPALHQVSDWSGGDLVVSVWLHATDDGHAAYLATELLEHFAIDSADDEQGVLDVTIDGDAGTVRRQITCVLNGKVEVEKLQGVPAIVHLPLRASNPSWYAGSDTTVNSALNGTTPVNVSCVGGTADSFPTITITTTGDHVCLNLKITDAYSNWLELEDTMAISKALVLILEPGALSFLYDGSTNWYGKRKTGSQLIVVKRGTHNLVFECDTADSLATISVVYRKRYTVHGG